MRGNAGQVRAMVAIIAATVRDAEAAVERAAATASAALSAAASASRTVAATIAAIARTWPAFPRMALLPDAAAAADAAEVAGFASAFASRMDGDARIAHRAAFNSGAWRNPGDGSDPGWRPSWCGCGGFCTPCELDYAALLASFPPAEREDEARAELEALCKQFWPAAATWFA